MRPALPILGLAALLMAGCGVSEEYEQALTEGRRLFREGHYDRARERLDEALTHEPDEAPALFLSARTLARLGRFAEAYTRFKALLANEDFPAFPTSDKGLVFREMGALLLRQAVDRGQTPFYFKALKFFNDALRAEPDAFASLFGKGVCLFGLDKVYSPDPNRESAHEYFQRCARVGPSRPEALYYLGLCHEKDRRLSSLEALETYRKAVDLYGDVRTIEPEAVESSSVFETAVRRLDGNYLLRLLRQIVPLIARIGAEKLGLEPAEARKLARRYFDAYVRLGGAEEMPAETVRWMEGTAAPAVEPGPGPGPAPGPGPGTARTGLRPSLELLAPEGGDLRTSRSRLRVEAQVTDDRKGATLRVWANEQEIHPAFDMRFFEGVPFGKGTGVRTVASFEVELGRGANAFRLKASDTEGLGSEDVTFTVTHRPASVYALVTACAGPGDQAALALRDAERFLAFLSRAAKLPQENRRLLTGGDLAARSFEKALADLGGELFEEDVLVVYFAGLGARVTTPAGPQWGLALHGFDGRQGEGFLPLSRLGRLLGEHAFRRLVVVLDASFTGGSGPGLRTASGAPSAEPGSMAGRVGDIFGVPEDRRESFVFLGASDGRGEAVELRKPSASWKAGGLFTTLLLRGLADRDADADRDGRVTLAELRPYLADRVSFFSARLGHGQVPLIAGPDDQTLLR